MRQCLLEPWKKTGIVLLLHGKEGTGKSLLVDKLFIDYIWGKRNSVSENSLDNIAGHFNAVCMNKCLILCNEVHGNEDWGVSFDKLKSLITDDRMCINKKGIDTLTDYPNYINFIFTTNNLNAVKMGQTDRRYCCVDTSPRYIGDREYFIKLSKLIEDRGQEVGDHLYTYVCNLPKTRDIRDIPLTKLRKDMLENSMSTQDKFADDIKRFDRFGVDMRELDDSGWEYEYIKYSKCLGGNDFEIKASDLYKVYSTWCRENGETRRKSIMFGRAMSSILTGKHTMKGKVYIIPNYASE